MDAANYRRAIAECLRDAACSGQIESRYRIGRGTRKVMQDARQLSVCYYLLDTLVAVPYWTHEPRLFMALQPIQPELGRCVTELRRLIHVEEYVRKGELILGQLQARVKPEETAELSDSARQLL